MTQPSLFCDVAAVRRTNSVAAEVTRRDGAKERILSRLQRGPASNAELNDIAFRYSARLEELRKRGWLIVSTPQGGGQWMYTLQGKR